MYIRRHMIEKKMVRYNETPFKTLIIDLHDGLSIPITLQYLWHWIIIGPAVSITKPGARQGQVSFSLNILHLLLTLKIQAILFFERNFAEFSSLMICINFQLLFLYIKFDFFFFFFWKKSISFTKIRLFFWKINYVYMSYRAFEFFFDVGH